jgi:hypothetical protein
MMNQTVFGQFISATLAGIKLKVKKRAAQGFLGSLSSTAT